MIWKSLVRHSQVARMTALDLLSADTENSSLRETLVVEALLPLPRRIFWIRNSESVSYYRQQTHPPPRPTHLTVLAVLDTERTLRLFYLSIPGPNPLRTTLGAPSPGMPNTVSNRRRWGITCRTCSRDTTLSCGLARRREALTFDDGASLFRGGLICR